MLMSMASLVWVGCACAESGLHGYLEAQGRWFPEAGLWPEQTHWDPSLAARIDWQRRFGILDVVIAPFVRWDAVDKERTHADLREASIRFEAADWDWQIGIGQVFWGVAESRHLIDIINQADQVEDIDEEERLGQPMIRASRSGDWGTLDLFVLPWFRERTYPGPHGRLYLPVDADHPIFESDAEQRHLDWAARWSRSFPSLDLGLGWFSGTRRDPRLGPDVRNGLLTLHYDLINQVSLDVQGALDNWVLKLEGFYRDTPLDDYAALVGGFEHTLYGIGGTAADLGLLAEYLYDGRDTSLETPFQNDLFLGLRLALNDTHGSSALGGVFIDLEHDSLFWRIEASRRIGQDWTLAVELQGFPRTQPGEPIYFWRDDGYAQLELRRWF